MYILDLGIMLLCVVLVPETIMATSDISGVELKDNTLVFNVVSCNSDATHPERRRKVWIPCECRLLKGQRCISVMCSLNGTDGRRLFVRLTDLTKF